MFIRVFDPGKGSKAIYSSSVGYRAFLIIVFVVSSSSFEMEFVQDTREHLRFDWNDDDEFADDNEDVFFIDDLDVYDDLDVTRSLWTNTYANTHTNEWFLNPDDEDPDASRREDTNESETFHATIQRVLDRLYPTDSPSDTIED